MCRGVRIFASFITTQQDLIDTLVPYFREGLHQNEFCMWITSDPLGVDEAKAALRQAAPDLEDYLKRGQIEILDYSQWYTASGKFEADRVLKGWIDKEMNRATKRIRGTSAYRQYVLAGKERLGRFLRLRADGQRGDRQL